MDQPSDIRNLSAHRPVSAPVVELRSPAQLRPDLRDAIEPVRRQLRPSATVVIREHTNNAVRWKLGERLNHVLSKRPASASRENDAVRHRWRHRSAIANSTAAPTRLRVI